MSIQELKCIYVNKCWSEWKEGKLCDYKRVFIKNSGNFYNRIM